jgi:hypothetical protein
VHRCCFFHSVPSTRHSAFILNSEDKQAGLNYGIGPESVWTTTVSVDAVGASGCLQNFLENRLIKTSCYKSLLPSLPLLRKKKSDLQKMEGCSSRQHILSNISLKAFSSTYAVKYWNCENKSGRNNKMPSAYTIQLSMHAVPVASLVS